jgi:hypothetical protein
MNDLLSDLLRQSCGVGEIIVVDQGGLSAATCEGLAQASAAGTLRLLWQEERCAAKARNEGVRQARFPIVIILDDDIRLNEDFLANHLKHYSDPRVGAVAGAVVHDGRPLGSDIPYHYYLPYIGYAHFPLHFDSVVDGIANLPSGNMSMLRNLFLEAGGFDEQFQYDKFVDADFSLRAYRVLAKKGLIARHDPSAAFLHLLTSEGRTRLWVEPDDEGVVANRNQWDMTFYFLLKNFGWAGSWREIAARLRLFIFRRPCLKHPSKLWPAWKEMTQGLRWARRRLKEGSRLMPECPDCNRWREAHPPEKYFWLKGAALNDPLRNYGSLFWTARRLLNLAADFEREPPLRVKLGGQIKNSCHRQI